MLRRSFPLFRRIQRAVRPATIRFGRILVTAMFLAGFVFTALPAQPVRAAMTINVSTISDNTTNDGFCSLREALSYTNGAPANLNCGPDTGTPYTINLPAGTYNITGGELQVGAPGNRTVTINGAGAASTVINQTLTTARVFDLDPVVAGNVDVTISNVTISGGYAQAFGGGAILGGGAGDSLILSDSIITNNHTSGANSAAGISWSPAGSVTITNTTFSNNVSGQAAGAILFTTNDGSTLTITDSTFTGNTAGAASASAGGAIVLGMPGAGTPPTFIITHNTFTGNQATNAAGAGGAIYIGSGNLTFQYNRIVGNTAGVAGSGGLAVYGGTATATRNWWGCNTGPGGACNGALLSAGTLTTSPYLYLGNYASPATINAGEASTLTATFLLDSNSIAVPVANLSRVIGLPVSWSATNGTLSGQQATIQASGTATATLTNSNVCANSTGSATVDSATATATLTVQCPDLTATKLNNVGGTTVLPAGWNWTVHIANGGAGYAAFANGVPLLTDPLPNTGLTYGAPTVSGASGLTGTVTCAIDGSSDLSCTASGPVQLAAGGSFDVVFSVTPGAAGPFANPRSGGSCAVDPGGAVTESSKVNNTCSNSVAVNAPPVITSADNTPFEVGVAGSFTVTTTPGYPVATTITRTGTLPSGLTFVDNGDGTATLSGTPAAGTAGTYPLTITASNGVNPNATQDFTITVEDNPRTLSFTRQTPPASPTNADTLVFRATFSEAVTGVDAADFDVAGTTTATVTNVSTVSTSVYDVTVSGGDLANFNGNVGLNLNSPTIADLASNPLPNTEPVTDETYTLDNTAPTITINNPDTLSATSKTITASTSDGTLTMSNTTGLTCDGTLTFVAYSSQTFTSEADNGTRVCYRAADALGNTAYSPSDPIAGIDTTLPDVTIDEAVGQVDPTNISPVNFAVQFTESVADFTVGDVTFGGTAGPMTVNVSGGPATYNIAVSGMTTPGTVVITIAADAAHDAASNGNTASNNVDNTVIFTFGTATALASSNLSTIVGQTVTFTATVTAAGGTPTGTVEFREGVVVLGTDTLDAGGQATFSTSALALGTHNITAYYLGGAGYNASNSIPPLAQVIGLANTTTAIATSGSPSGFGTLVTFTATVTVVAPGAGAPTGNVEFFDGGISLGTGTLGAGGQATLATSSLTTGSHTITVAYGGDANFNGSTSPGITQVIDGPPGVSRINSVADTGDGQVVENEHTSVNITQLLVVFNKDMNAADAGNFSNYHLVRDGSPVDLINSATYVGGTLTTTLDINAPLPLPDGRYTLTVEGDIRDVLTVPIGADFVRVFFVDNAAPTLTSVATVQNGAAIIDGATINVRFSSIDGSFNEDVSNAGGGTGADDVTNPQNYLLITAGPNGMFDTPTCAAGLTNDDVQIPTGPVTYSNGGGSGPFVATVQLNNGTPLANGLYRLYVCGTTSIVDLADNALNSGADDQRTFTILVTTRRNPQTGFAPGVVTILPEQPADKAYADLGSLWIEIPKLNLKTNITGVPLTANGWDVTWLNRQVGWLEGTAYPTWEGNTVLTAHGYTADGEAGPFALLKNLSYGETIIIHLGGMKYTYAVRTNLLISPNDTRWLTKHETLDWVTLITCQQYDAKTKSYRYRRVVRAVLISVEPE